MSMSDAFLHPLFDRTTLWRRSTVADSGRPNDRHGIQTFDHAGRWAMGGGEENGFAQRDQSGVKPLHSKEYKTERSRLTRKGRVRFLHRSAILSGNARTDFGIRTFPKVQ